MKIIEIEEGDRVDGDLLEFLIVSGRLKTEEEPGMRKFVVDAVDPMVATEPEFEFENRPDEDEMYISLE